MQAPTRADVVVLVASAGAVGALTTVLRDLPYGVPAAVVAQLHLTSPREALVDLSRSAPGKRRDDDSGR